MNAFQIMALSFFIIGASLGIGLLIGFIYLSIKSKKIFNPFISQFEANLPPIIPPSPFQNETCIWKTPLGSLLVSFPGFLDDESWKAWKKHYEAARSEFEQLVYFKKLAERPAKAYMELSAEEARVSYENQARASKLHYENEYKSI